MKHSRYLVAGLLSLGLVSLLRPSPDSPRRQLLDLRKSHTQALAQSELNLENQFTPGYKSRNPWNDENNLNWQQGVIFKTRIPSDLAINGVGCFGLQSQGEIAYTRDGRFRFVNGVLSNEDGWSLMGMPVDQLGNIIGEAGPIRLELEPTTNLYAGRYTGYQFDEAGKLYGEITTVDPVTGEQSISKTPLYQVVLFQFPNSNSLRDRTSFNQNIWAASGPACSGLPGQGALGGLCPGSLELSNVDLKAEGTTLKWIAQRRRVFAAQGPASPFQQDLLARLKSDSQLRQAALDNLSHQLTPGYRTWDLLNFMETGRLKLRLGRGKCLLTHNAYDLAVDGEALLVLSTGEVTRNGHLIWTPKGLACGQPEGGLLMGYASGSRKLEPIVVPAQAANLEISSNGEMLWTDLAGDGRPECHYKIALARANELTRSGLHLRPTGKVLYGVAGPALDARIVQGYLETPDSDDYEESLEAGALLELAGLPPFFVDDLK